MVYPCPMAGGGDQEARCPVGSVAHLRLDSCCGAHAGGRTLLLDFCGKMVDFMVDFVGIHGGFYGKVMGCNWNAWWFHGDFMAVFFWFNGVFWKCDLMVGVMGFYGDSMVIWWEWIWFKDDLVGFNDGFMELYCHFMGFNGDWQFSNKWKMIELNNVFFCCQVWVPEVN